MMGSSTDLYHKHGVNDDMASSKRKVINTDKPMLTYWLGMQEQIPVIYFNQYFDILIE